MLAIAHTFVVPIVVVLVVKALKHLGWAGMTSDQIVESSGSSMVDNFDLIVVGIDFAVEIDFAADIVVDFAANCFQLELED